MNGIIINGEWNELIIESGIHCMENGCSLYKYCDGIYCSEFGDILKTDLHNIHFVNRGKVTKLETEE